MMSVRKNLFGTLLIVVLLVGGVALIMGQDLVPWIKTVKKSAKERLEDLVDKSELDLEKAHHQIERAKERAIEARRVYLTTTRRIKESERGVEKIRARLSEVQSEIAYLGSGRTVRTISGRELGSQEADLRLTHAKNERELLTTDLEFRETLLKKQKQRTEHLEIMNQRIPMELAKLNLSVRHLAAKVQTYKQHLALLESEDEMDGLTESMFAKAERTLEEAHADIDARLSELDLLFTTSDKVPLEEINHKPAARPNGREALQPLQQVSR